MRYLLSFAVLLLATLPVQAQTTTENATGQTQEIVQLDNDIETARMLLNTHADVLQRLNDNKENLATMKETIPVATLKQVLADQDALIRDQNKEIARLQQITAQLQQKKHDLQTLNSVSP